MSSSSAGQGGARRSDPQKKLDENGKKMTLRRVKKGAKDPNHKNILSSHKSSQNFSTIR